MRLKPFSQPGFSKAQSQSNKSPIGVRGRRAWAIGCGCGQWLCRLCVLAHNVSMQVHVSEVHRRVVHMEVASYFPTDSTRCPHWQAPHPTSVKPGLAVKAKAGGLVSAEGEWGALSVVTFIGLLVGSIICEGGIWGLWRGRSVGDQF